MCSCTFRKQTSPRNILLLKAGPHATFCKKFCLRSLKTERKPYNFRASTRCHVSHQFRSVLCNIAMEEVLLLSTLACCLVEKKRLKRLRSTRRSRWSRKWLLKEWEGGEGRGGGKEQKEYEEKQDEYYYYYYYYYY